MTDPFQGIAGPQTLLIIAPVEFMSPLQPLVEHKNQAGMPTISVSIPSLTAYFTGEDDPAAIKAAIRYVYESLSTEYVMLVGDAHCFPVRYRTMWNLSVSYGDGTGVVPTDGAYVPSDLYYANLYHHTGTYPDLVNTAFDNWDANGNGRYNEGTWLAPNPLTTTNPDNVDGYPDLCVARVTAHIPEDVTAYVQKVIAYETTSPRAVNLTFIADQQYGGSVDLTSNIITNSKVMGKLSASQVRYLLIENPKGYPCAVATWGPNRLDIFGLGTDDQMYHRAWDGSEWLPSANWEGLGGLFDSLPAVVSWDANRLDIFARGLDHQMYHKAWDGSAWLPSPGGWEALGGPFAGPPAVATWGTNRLDIFAVDETDGQIKHKAWDGSAWLPSPGGWEALGGSFTSPPAIQSWGGTSDNSPGVAAWAPNRLDIFALDADDQMLHKAWDGGAWLPSPTSWESLGGPFASPPAVATWGPNRLDVFAVDTEGQMRHKARDGAGWLTSPTDWEALGGPFAGPPTVVTWAANRLDIFALDTDGQMKHKAWDGARWLPSPTGWEALGGVFQGPPPSHWTAASADDVTASAMSSSWVGYLGHGGTAEWGHSGNFFVNDNVTRTSGSTAFPIVFAAGCQTGEFITGHPWNGEYVDLTGSHHDFQVLSQSKPNTDGPVIIDNITQQSWGNNCKPSPCNPLPLTAPKPNAYDYDRSDACFAYPWLIGSAPGGAIAYFGENGVLNDLMADEMETYMLASYANASHPVLGDLYLKAQQQYWSNHQTDQGQADFDYDSVSRFYLGIITFFGDPSLRLPPLSPTARIKAFTLSPLSVPAGSAVTGTVTLADPAPPGSNCQDLWIKIF